MSNATEQRTHKVQPFIVHKEGEEGTLQIDALTGMILTEDLQRPDWSEGLTTALLGERATFYEKRLSKESAAFQSLMREGMAIEFADLGWIGVNADQQEIEIEASDEYRQERVAELLGINTETGDMGVDVVAEREVDAQPGHRTPRQATALEEAMKSGFAVSGDQQAAKKQAQGGAA